MMVMSVSIQKKLAGFNGPKRMSSMNPPCMPRKFIQSAPKGTQAARITLWNTEFNPLKGNHL
jgi:hypothetical protein